MSERKETPAQTVIRAPVSGTVGSRNAEVGMMVDGNSRLFTLGQLDNIRIQVELTDRMLNYIETGQRVIYITAHSHDNSDNRTRNAAVILR
jgi:HlyD family secretion protein